MVACGVKLIRIEIGHRPRPLNHRGPSRPRSSARLGGIATSDQLPRPLQQLSG